MATPTTTLPADKFDKTMTFVRPATPPSRVPLDKLAVLPGFNTRVKDAEYSERVAGITQSIVEHGYFDDKPFAVTMLPNDETVYVYDGEHRFDATRAAVLDGAEFPDGLPVAWAKDGATVRDLTVHLARGNEGAALNMVESAAVVRRLLDIGLDKPEIAKAINRSERHVENLITLGTSNSTVKKAVAEGKIAGAEAVKMVRKMGAKEAGEKIVEKVREAEAKGKAKATPKTMAASAPAGPKMKRVEHTVNLATGDTLASVLSAISAHLSGTAKFDDDEKLTEDGKVVIAISVIDHEAAAKAAKEAEERAARTAQREKERAENAARREKEKAEREAAKAKAAVEKEKAAKKAAAEKAKAAKPKTEAKAKGETKTPAKAKPRTARPKAADAAPAGEDPNKGL